MRIEQYLASCGAAEVKEVRPHLWQFRLPGDNIPAGRATTTRDGQARIWHRGAREGLMLSDQWQPAAVVDLALDRSVPSYVARLDDLTAGEKIAKRPPQPQKYLASDPEVEAAALAVLESYGWRQQGRDRGIIYLNDGTGSTPACRLAVKEGLASVWSFRGDVDLPAPWRPGRSLQSGEKTMFATARDLGVAVSLAPAVNTPSLPPGPVRQPVDRALATQVIDWWQRGEKAPQNHRHLTKSHAQLRGDDLRQMPPDSKHPGDLVVPMFRPVDPSGATLEVSGGQRLCAGTQMGTDKMLLPGSRLAESFVPIPFSPLLDGGEASIDKWIQSLDGGKALKDRPLVVCEGVATALAIYESGAGYPIAAISSGNAKNVAKWLSENGHTANFPDFVIAGDYDVGLKNGKAASQAIKKTLEAATETGAKVSLPPPGSPVGTDARDLYAQGPEAVCDYVGMACAPSIAAKRPDIQKFLSRAAEQSLER
ncbi:hypothetical protein MASR1M60_22690 [Rhodocyclaceae bacterium]